MKRRILLVALVAALAAGVWWHTTGRPRDRTSLARDVAELAGAGGITSFDGKKALSSMTSGEEGENTGNPLEQAVGLAIQGIRLFQGDKGLELWRLNATWAHLSQDGEVINVDNPHVVYALGDTGLPPSRPGAPDITARENATDTPAPTPPLSAEGEQAVSPPEADVLDVMAQKGRITDHQQRLSLWDDVVITRFGDTITGPRLEYDSATRVMTFPNGATLESERGSGTAAVLHWDLAKNEITGLNGVEVILKPRPRQTDGGLSSAEPSGENQAERDAAASTARP